MIVSIDRVEDGIATLEWPDRVMTQIPVEELPQGCVGGDVLTVTEDGGFTLNNRETERLRKANIDLFNSLLED